MIGHRRLRWVVVIVVAAAVVSLPAPALAASALCAQAAELVRSADPGAALALIDKRKQELDALAGEDTGSLCGPQVDTARSNQEEADALVAKAKGLSDPQEKAKALDDAKKLDAKDAELVKLTTQPTPAEDAAEQWKTFLSDHVQPFGAPATVALAIALGWLVLGRVLIQVYSAKRKLPAGKHAWRWILPGALLAVASGLLFTFVLPTDHSVGRYVAVGAVGLAGAGLLSCGLASRLRLTIEATPSTEGKDTPSPARIVAILRKLGADSPRGMEVPVGTDVGVLSDAVTKASSVGWIANIVGALTAILGFTPWKVVLHRTAGGTAVVITRNGRTMDATNVSADILGAGMPSGTPDVLIASFILMTMADGYRDRAGFEGLLGSNSWKSIGLVASTQKEIAPPAATSRAEVGRLLSAAALQEDNPFSRMALHEHLYRDRKEPAVAEGYAQWLYKEARKSGPAARPGVHPEAAAVGASPPPTTMADRMAIRVPPGPAQPADLIRARLLYASLVVTLNVLETKNREAVATERLGTTYDSLVALLAGIQSQDGAIKQLKAQVATLKPAVEARTDEVNAQTAGARARGRWTLKERRMIEAVALDELGPGAYNAMCRAAVTSGDGGQSLAKAVALYTVVSVDPELRAWSLNDPTLTALRRDPRMWEVVAESNDVLDVAPFAADAEALRKVGIASVGTIAETKPQTLAELIGIARARAVRLVQLAQVLNTLPPKLRDRSADIATILVTTSATNLTSLPAKIEAVAAKLRAVPGFRPGEPLSTEAETWLGSHDAQAVAPGLTDVESRRRDDRERAAAHRLPAFDGTITDDEHDHVPTRRYVPAGHGTQRAVVFLHGGFGVSGDLELHSGYCQKLAEGLGTVVLSVDYSLAPEATLDDAVDEALIGLQVLSGEGFAQLFLCGDSAGGAVATLAAARADGSTPLMGLLLTEPNLDLTLASYDDTVPGGPDRTLSAAAFSVWAAVASLADAPRLDSLAGRLPSTVVAVGTLDSLRVEAHALQSACALAGVYCRVIDVPGATHGFTETDAVDGVVAAFREFITSSNPRRPAH